MSQACAEEPPVAISPIPPKGFYRILIGRDGFHMFVMPHEQSGYYFRAFVSPRDEKGDLKVTGDTRGVPGWWFQDPVPTDLLAVPPYRDVECEPLPANPLLYGLSMRRDFVRGDSKSGQLFRDF